MYSILIIAFALVALVATVVTQETSNASVSGRNPINNVLIASDSVPEIIKTSEEVLSNGVPDTLTSPNNTTPTPQLASLNKTVPSPPENNPIPRVYDFHVPTLPIPYEQGYFIERTRSDMTEYLDRASRDVDFAESQISLATEFARTSISNDLNEAKNFVIQNHESQFNEAVQNVIDEDFLWECAKKGEKIIEAKAQKMANRVNDCIKRAANAAMDVVTSTKSHIAEDRTRRVRKYNEDIKRLTSCMRQQERHCVREQINLIDRNVNSLAADAKNEVERVHQARQQQILEFGVCRTLQNQSFLELISESDRIVDRCLRNAFLGRGSRHIMI